MTSETDPAPATKMADANHLNIAAIVRVFRDIVKRKILYNETNLHYEYFEIAGDTIPFKTYGYQTLREFIERNAGDHFYFVQCGGDAVYIAPRRGDKAAASENDSPATANESAGERQLKANLSQMKAIESRLNAIQAQMRANGRKNVPPEPAKPDKDQATKSVKCVSENMHFMAPQSTGLCNPFQNVRNDIRVSVDRHTARREIGHQMDMDTETMADEEAPPLVEPTAGKMYFPWDDRYWHLKVTHVVSMDEIWARFYDEFEESMRKISAQLIGSPRKHPRRIVSNKMYAFEENRLYHRVEVVRFEEETGQFKCFLCDIGSTKWLDQSQIVRCPSAVRHVAPLAIRFSLHELAAFKESRKACELVVSELHGKCVWARIMVTEPEYRANRPRSIPAILYDAGDKKRRHNISSAIMEKLVATFSAPKLLPRRTNYVKVSHVSTTNGIIYGHITHSMNDLRFINQMICSKVAAGPRPSYTHIHAGTELHVAIAKHPDRLHLVYTAYDRCWYRAIILELETDFTKSNDLKRCSAYCFLVDYGLTRSVRLADIHELNGILSIYPYFAVAMLLDGVRMAPEIVAQLKGILSPGDDVMVDVVRVMDSAERNKTKSVALVKMQQLRKYHDTTRLYDINQLV